MKFEEIIYLLKYKKFGPLAGENPSDLDPYRDFCKISKFLENATIEDKSMLLELIKSGLLDKLLINSNLSLLLSDEDLIVATINEYPGFILEAQEVNGRNVRIFQAKDKNFVKYVSLAFDSVDKEFNELKRKGAYFQTLVYLRHQSIFNLYDGLSKQAKKNKEIVFKALEVGDDHCKILLESNKYMSGNQDRFLDLFIKKGWSSIHWLPDDCKENPEFRLKLLSFFGATKKIYSVGFLNSYIEKTINRLQDTGYEIKDEMKTERIILKKIIKINKKYGLEIHMTNSCLQDDLKIISLKKSLENKLEIKDKPVKKSMKI